MTRLFGIDASKLVFRPADPFGWNSDMKDLEPPPTIEETLGAAARIRGMLGVAAAAIAPVGRPYGIRRSKGSDCFSVETDAVGIMMDVSDGDVDLYLSFGDSAGLRASAPISWGSPGIRHFRSAVALFAAATQGIGDRRRGDAVHRDLQRRAALTLSEGQEEALVMAPLPWHARTSDDPAAALEVRVEGRSGIARLALSQMEFRLDRSGTDALGIMRMLGGD
jgi:hypothetical protein